MIKGLFAVALLSVVLSSSSAEAKAIRYPMIQFVQGSVMQIMTQVEVVNKEAVKTEKPLVLKKNVSLRDKAMLRTDSESEVRVALSDKSTLVIQENSQVEFPAIAWEDGKVEEIRLTSGSMRYICQSGCDRKIVTPLFDNVLPVGDYLIHYNPEVPRVELVVVSGEVSFRGLENEFSVVLKSGEKASFTGILENQEPAYDVLLKGRKVAKGKLSEVQKLPGVEIEKIRKKEETRLKILRKPPATKRTKLQICDKPWGELNQCVWICENNKKGAKDCKLDAGAQCVRMRCNANGVWSDRIELSPTESKCLAKPMVGMCDY